MGTFSPDFEFTDLITYGTATPPVGTAPEGAQYFVTADGTETGSILETWTYDAAESVWVQDPDLDVCEINEFIHNMTPLTLTMSHENTAQNVVIRFNGVGVTLENIVGPITENGGGSISFGNGANSNFNAKRANTVERVENVGDYFEFTSGAVAAFRTLALQITTDETDNAEGNNGNYRFTVASGGVNLIDGDNSVVFSTGQEAGTFRMTRTLRGFTLTVNGNQVYTTPLRCVDYEGEQNARLAALEATAIATATGTTGFYRIGRFAPANPIDVNGAPTVTGFDLTAFPNLTLRISHQDVANPRGWDLSEVDVDNMLARFAAGDAVDAYVHIFDNDFFTINVNDASTGELVFAGDAGRAAQIRYVELWITASGTPSFSLLSPDGTEWSVTVDNTGALTTVAV